MRWQASLGSRALALVVGALVVIGCSSRSTEMQVGDVPDTSDAAVDSTLGDGSEPLEVIDGAEVDASDVGGEVAPSPFCASDEECLALVDGGGPCIEVRCHPILRVCEAVLAPLGSPCEGQGPCVEGAYCIEGICAGGVAVVCDDGNPCTDDACHVTDGCTSVPTANGASCSDGTWCTSGDTCLDGVCTGTPTDECECASDDDCVPFEDGDACNGTLVCSAAGTCVVDAQTVVACVGETPCRTASCDPATGSCVQIPAADGTICADDSWCTVATTCQAGSCGGGIQVDCDDGDPCTTDACEPASGCQHSPVAEGSPCDDGNPCTTGEACTAGFCVTDQPSQCECLTDAGCAVFEVVGACGVELECIENHCVVNPATITICDQIDVGPCRVNVCEASTGLCVDAPALDGSHCDDGDACTHDDVCTEGACGGVAVTCDDGIECTEESCDPTTGTCFSAPVEEGTPCNDGDPCTVDDGCFGTGCVGFDATTVPVAEGGCDDGIACTLDTCTTEEGCLSTPDDQACEGGAPCETVSCSATEGCVTAPALDGVWCDDGDDQTVDDACIAGVCQGLVDADGDGIADEGYGVVCAGGTLEACDDNCPGLQNPDQLDSDGDAVGDPCDSCPDDADPTLVDNDGDGLGDVCDPFPGGFAYAPFFVRPGDEVILLGLEVGSSDAVTVGGLEASMTVLSNEVVTIEVPYVSTGGPIVLTKGAVEEESALPLLINPTPLEVAPVHPELLSGIVMDADSLYIGWSDQEATCCSCDKAAAQLARTEAPFDELELLQKEGGGETISTNGGTMAVHDGLLFWAYTRGTAPVATGQVCAQPVVHVRSSSDGGSTFTTDVVFDAIEGTEDGGSGSGGRPLLVSADDGLLVSWFEQVGTSNTEGDLFVARGTMGGTQWSEPTQVTFSAASNLDYSHDMTWTGEVAAIAIGILDDTLPQVYLIRSDDAGVSWDAPVLLSDQELGGSSPTIAGLGQDLVVTWTSHLGSPGVFCAVSHDAGLSWTTHTVVSPTFLQINSNSLVGMTPEGTIYVAFTRKGSTSLNEVYLTRSADGGVTWQAPARLDGAFAEEGRLGHAYVDQIVIGDTLFIPWYRKNGTIHDFLLSPVALSWSTTMEICDASLEDLFDGGPVPDSTLWSIYEYDAVGIKTDGLVSASGSVTVADGELQLHAEGAVAPGGDLYDWYGWTIERGITSVDTFGVGEGQRLVIEATFTPPTDQNRAFVFVSPTTDGDSFVMNDCNKQSGYCTEDVGTGKLGVGFTLSGLADAYYSMVARPTPTATPYFDLQASTLLPNPSYLGPRLMRFEVTQSTLTLYADGEELVVSQNPLPLLGAAHVTLGAVTDRTDTAVDAVFQDVKIWCEDE